MVEWKKLGDICEIIRGNGVQKTDFVDSGFGCIHYGQIYTHYGPFAYTTNRFVSEEVFEKARKASKGDIIMTDTSENVEDICKSVAYLGEEDIAVSNHALILKHKQNPKFITYSTLTDSFFAQKRKYVVGAKVSGIKPEHLAKIKIYLPSLSEQTRIVGILDTFTSSIDNLKEQIAQRRKQYEYYRDQLLDLEGKPGVEMKTLGEVCIKPQNIKWKLEAPENEYCYIDLSSVNLETKQIEATTLITKENAPSRAQQIVNEGDIILGTTRPTLRRYCQISEQYNNQICSTGYCVFRVNKTIVLSKWIFHNIGNIKFWEYCETKQQGAGYPCLANADAFAYTIPLPPLKEQQRIVSILDTFEASIQNLEEQLKLREKQYEYYRNKLLTFE